MKARWLNITDESGNLLDRIDLSEWDLTKEAACLALCEEIRSAW